MSIFSKPKAPPVTPYTDVVKQQTEASQNAAQSTQKLNSTNQNTPINSLSYTYDPTTGQYTATNQYSPQQQALLDYLQGTQASAGQQGQNLLAGAGYGSGQPDISGNASSQTEKLIAQQMQQLRPEQDYQLQNLQNQLINSGIPPDSEQGQARIRQFTANRDNNNAANAAQFENQAYGQALQNYQLPASMAENLAGFGSPQSAVANLWGTPTTQVQTPDVTAAYNAQNTAAMNRYKAQSDQYSGLMKGIFGTIAGTAAAPFTGGASLAAIPGMFGGSSGGSYTPQQFSQMAYAPGVTGQFAPPIY